MDKIENVELVPILFEQHCGYLPKNIQVGTFVERLILMNISLELLTLNIDI